MSSLYFSHPVANQKATDSFMIRLPVVLPCQREVAGDLSVKISILWKLITPKNSQNKADRNLEHCKSAAKFMKVSCLLEYSLFRHEPKYLSPKK